MGCVGKYGYGSTEENSTPAGVDAIKLYNSSRLLVSRILRENPQLLQEVGGSLLRDTANHHFILARLVPALLGSYMSSASAGAGYDFLFKVIVVGPTGK